MGQQDGRGGDHVLGDTTVLGLGALGDHSQSHQQWEIPMLGRLDCLGVQGLGGAGVQGCHQSTGTQLGSVRNEALEEE